MNILIVTQYFWPENFRINELSAELVDRGHRVTVLTGIPNYPNGRFFPGYGVFKRRRESYRGCEVIRVPLIPRGKGRGVELVANYLSFAAIASVFALFLRRDSVDVIFVWESSPVTVGIPAIVLKRLSSAPIVFWVLDLWPESLSATGAIRSELILRMVARLVRFIYRSCDLILVSSKGFLPSVEMRLGVPGRVRYFPNWAEEIYQPVLERPDGGEFSAIPEGFRIMFAGNIGAAQDFGTILGAAEELREFPDIHWLLVGDGRMREWVHQQIGERKLEGTVHLCGSHPPEAMPEWFFFADSMLVTLRRDPVFSLTAPGRIQSYLACGKPVVAALEGEGRKLIEESGAGMVCPPEDSAALARAVLEMYRLPKSERAAMGERGRQYCSMNFERSSLMQRLAGWLEEVANRTPEAPRPGATYS